MKAKELIEARVSNLLGHGVGDQNRVVVCIYELEGVGFWDLPVIPIKQSEYDEDIEFLLKTLTDKMRKRQIPISREIYILFWGFYQGKVINTTDLKEKLKMFEFTNIYIERCVIGERVIEDAFKEVTWFVDDTEDANAVLAFLLENALYSETIFSENIRKKGFLKYKLKLQECNTIMEIICQQLWNSVEYQLKQNEDTEDTEKKIEKYLTYPGMVQEEIELKFPEMKWIPMTGYDKLLNEIRKSRSCLSKLKKKFSGNNIDDKMKIGSLLNKLYDGGDEDSSIRRAEIIRKEFIEKGVGIEIDKYLNDYKKSIQENVYNYFTIHESELPIAEKIQSKKSNLEQEMRKNEEKIELLLESQYTLTEKNLKTGLKEYEELFNKSIKLAGWCFYWGRMISVVNECRNRIQEQKKNLNELKIVLENSVYAKPKKNILKETNIKNFRYENLKNYIENLPAGDISDFTISELRGAIEYKNGFYSEGSRVATNEELHPSVYLIASDSLVTEENKDEVLQNVNQKPFVWNVIRERYLSPRQVYLIRVLKIK